MEHFIQIFITTLSLLLPAGGLLRSWECRSNPAGGMTLLGRVGKGKPHLTTQYWRAISAIKIMLSKKFGHNSKHDGRRLSLVICFSFIFTDFGTHSHVGKHSSKEIKDDVVYHRSTIIAVLYHKKVPNCGRFGGGWVSFRSSIPEFSPARAETRNTTKVWQSCIAKVQGVQLGWRNTEALRFSFGPCSYGLAECIGVNR